MNIHLLGGSCKLHLDCQKNFFMISPLYFFWGCVSFFKFVLVKRDVQYLSEKLKGIC